jgi:hypothetical protein
LIPINVEDAKAQELAQVLGCQVGTMPFTYLGLPVGTTRPTVAKLMLLVDRVERRLTSTTIWLTNGGRVTFINFALSPLTIYARCVLKIPFRSLSSLIILAVIAFGGNQWTEMKRHTPLLLGTLFVNLRKREASA